jgi:hypothetical protein
MSVPTSQVPSSAIATAGPGGGAVTVLTGPGTWTVFAAGGGAVTVTAGAGAPSAAGTLTVTVGAGAPSVAGTLTVTVGAAAAVPAAADAGALDSPLPVTPTVTPSTSAAPPTASLDFHHCGLARPCSPGPPGC